MKIHDWIIILLLLGAVATHGGSLDADGDFRLLKADGMPLEWLIRRRSDPRCGTFTLLEESGTRMIRIMANRELEACFYTEPAFPVSPGEKIRVFLEERNTGGCQVKIYLYDADKRWITSFPLIDCVETRDFQKVDGEAVIAAQYPCDADGTKRSVRAIRIALVVPPGAEAVFRHVRAEKK